MGGANIFGVGSEEGTLYTMKGQIHWKCNLRDIIKASVSEKFLLSYEIQILISASVMSIKVLRNAFNFTKNTRWFKLYSNGVIHYQHASRRLSSIRCGITM